MVLEKMTKMMLPTRKNVKKKVAARRRQKGSTEVFQERHFRNPALARE
jgi:hypothetical protein